LPIALFATVAQAQPEGEGWISLFNGEDLTGWHMESDHDEIWSVVDGVIDCMPRTDLAGPKDLWTDDEFGDFELHIEWLIKAKKGDGYTMPIVLPDGTHKLDEDGEVITEVRPNADSGVYLRGSSKAQVNIWCWPIGSGEVWGYRTDQNMPAEVRAGVTPSENADNPVGEWNTFHITMKGDRLTVVLNDVTVIENAQLPGVPESGRLALQHHGGYNPETDTWNSASSYVQFRNIYVRPIE
jgi:hypothetical protein